MSVDVSLYDSIERAWMSVIGPQFEWGGYDCRFLGSSPLESERKFGIYDDGEVVGIFAFRLLALRPDGSRGPRFMWEVEPSPEQLMKMRLLV